MSIYDEKWFESRRVWSALLTAFAVAGLMAFPSNGELLALVFQAAAMALGLTSWSFPKK